MTYLEILIWFILPPCVLLAPWGARGLGRHGRVGRLAIPILAAIAFAYTTPWDNYLIWSGVWDSPDSRILGRIGFVPIEEYLFFLLQPALTGLWFGFVLTRWDNGDARMSSAESGRPTPDTIRRTGAVAGVVLTVLGAGMLSREDLFYMGALLAWAGPVLAGMWWYVGDRLWTRRYPILMGVTPPTLYLWFVDRLALSEGAWVISPRFTTGFAPWGLPIEEALFFLVTNVMVVLGISMLIFPRPPRAPAGSALPPPSGTFAPTALVALMVAGCGGPVPETVGVIDGELAPCPTTPNCVRSGETADLLPLVMVENSVEKWQEVVEVVASMPRTRLVHQTDAYLHAEVTTRLLRFVDDLELLWAGDTGQVWLRSASRVGRSDLGANANRVARLLRELRARSLVEAPSDGTR